MDAPLTRAPDVPTSSPPARPQRTRPALRRALLFGLPALAAAAVGAGYLWQARPAAAPAYVTVKVERGRVAPTVVSSGTVNPVTTVQVGTYVSGVIQSVSCDFNTRVKAGQLCARIDPRPYQVVVDQARAALATARAQLEKDRVALALARQALERGTTLLQRGFVSQEAVDTARSTYDQTVTQIALDEATIRQRESQLDAALINLGYTDIVSPVDGTVVSRNVTRGQTVAASFQTPTLFLIATDLTQMQVDTHVSEADIGRVAEGNPARFTVQAFPGRSFAGQVEQVRQAPQTVQNVVTYDVVVAAANADLALKPGMTASIRIEIGRADDVLRVPSQALRYHPTGAARSPAADADGAAARGRGAQLWVLADGVPRRVPVKPGLDDDSHVEIRGGELREGDLVIVSERAAAAARPNATGGGPRLPRM